VVSKVDRTNLAKAVSSRAGRTSPISKVVSNADQNQRPGKHRAFGLPLFSGRSHVRFGSEADMCGAIGHVRFTPESGHVRRERQCPLRANSGHRIIGVSNHSRLPSLHAQRFDDRKLAPFQYNTPQRSLFGALVLPIVTHSNQFLVCLAVPRFWAISSHLPKLGCFDRRPMTGRTVS